LNLEEYEGHVTRLWNVEPGLKSLFVMTTGLGGESGEVEDILKKWVATGQKPEKLDLEHLTEELGDTLFYLITLVRTFGLTIDDIMKYNIKKLDKRYSE